MAFSPGGSAYHLIAKSKNWGPPRVVEVYRTPGQGLGISIVGGKVGCFRMLKWVAPAQAWRVSIALRTVILIYAQVESDNPSQSSGIAGIFVKHVLPDSPAGQTRQLFTGDRLIEISGVQLRSSDHNVAVNAIKNATDPVRFVVQSLASSRRATPTSSATTPKVISCIITLFIRYSAMEDMVAQPTFFHKSTDFSDSHFKYSQ